MPGVRAANKVQKSYFFDKDLIGKAAEMAERRGTNLTQLIADLLSQELDAEDAARISRGRSRAGKKAKSSR